MSSRYVIDVLFVLICGILLERFANLKYQRRLERNLRAEQDKHRAVIDGIYDGFYELDRFGQLLGWNQSLLDMTGYGEDELRGLQYVSRINVRTVRQLRKAFIQVKQSRQPVKGYICKFVTKDREARVFEFSISLIYIREKHVGYRGIVRNVTKRRTLDVALEVQESRLRTLLNAMTDGVVFFAHNKSWFEVNHRAREIFHLPDGLDDFAHVDLTHFSEELAFALADEDAPNPCLSRQIVTREIQLYTETSDSRTYETVRVPVRNIQEEHLGTLLIIHDITNQKVAERRIRESEERYRSIVENHSDVVLTLGFDGEIRDVNSAIYPVLGYEPSEIIGTYMSSYMPPENWLAAQERLFSMVYGKTIDAPSKALRKDGTILDVSVKKIPILVNGEPVGLFSIVHDRTEENRLHEELRRMNEWNQLILNAAGEGIFAINLAGCVTRCNPTALDMLRASADSIIDCNFHNLFHHSYWDGSPYGVEDCPIYKSMNDGVVRRVTNEVFWRLNGTFFPVEYVCSPMVEAGEIIGAVVVAKDTTQQKENEELLLRSEKFSAIGQLAAGIAHEVRNPLTSLKGFLQLLQEKSENQYASYFQMMFSELERISNIVSEFLFLAKPQVSMMTWCNLAEIAKTVVALLEAEANLRNVEILFQVDEIEDLPWVFCENDRIKQVFLNLLKNAIEASDSGGRIHVSIHCEGSHIVTKIVDEGSGIPPDQLRRLGEPFYSTKQKGTGLGLMISRRIVDTHGGVLRICSEAGQGTSVRIELPIGGPSA